MYLAQWIALLPLRIQTVAERRSFSVYITDRNVREGSWAHSWIRDRRAVAPLHCYHRRNVDSYDVVFSISLSFKYIDIQQISRKLVSKNIREFSPSFSFIVIFIAFAFHQMFLWLYKCFNCIYYNLYIPRLEHIT